MTGGPSRYISAPEAIVLAAISYLVLQVGIGLLVLVTALAAHRLLRRAAPKLHICAYLGSYLWPR